MVKVDTGYDVENIDLGATKTMEGQRSPSPPKEHHTIDVSTTHLENSSSTPSPRPRHSPAQSKPINTNPFETQKKVRIIPESRRAQMNTAYLGTLPGILKLVEISLGFISFILAICADRRSTSAAWTEHVSFETTIVVTVLLIAYVIFPHITLADPKTKDGFIAVELLFYGVNTLFYFIAIWLMVHLSASWTAEGRGAAIMDSIICVALCALYAAETCIKVKVWRGECSELQSTSRIYPPSSISPQNYTNNRKYDNSSPSSNRDHSVV